MKRLENLADGAAVLARLQNDYHAFFPAGQPIVIARAPGRLDVMGGIADYSGATVCEMPLAEAAFVAIQPRADDAVCLQTTAEVATNEVKIELSELLVDYAAARHKLAADEATHWAAYVLGAFPVLAGERGVQLTTGANILLDSAVPLGKGVSSSAAIEVATLRALTTALSVAISNYDLAVLAQTLENRIVGAPCGLMDQLTSVFGEAGHLLRIECQPQGAINSMAIPGNVHFIGIDSGVRHAVTGASYGEVRVAAFMGYRIIADLLQLKVELSDTGQMQIEDPSYHGFLCNIPLAEFRARFLPLLPEQLRGDEFLARWGGTTDTVTKVNPAKTYAVRAATTHPIEEQARVEQFTSLLTQPMNHANLTALGEFMYQSHASYNQCGLGSEATDALVAAVRQAGPEQGLYGAKITGGGSGGTVAVLALGEKGIVAAEKVAAQHARNYDCPFYLFRGSSPGAGHMATMKLENL
jgi:galactokinase